MESEPTAATASSRGLIEYTHWIYALHALAVVIGLLTARAVAVRFAFGLPSIIAVIMNYARRAETRGTWLESHFRWQIRTFWFTWLWILVTSILAMPLLIVGIGFKFGAVPFHMWITDVYEGSPTCVTLFIGSAPKIAAFALIMRLLTEALALSQPDWSQMLIVLSVLSIIIGNVVAIAQTNLKRMLAYSTISHVGYILLGILAGTPQGYQAAMFYTITYVLVATGCFGMILLLARQGFEADTLDDFKGLNIRSPWFAGMMAIFMFSLAGLPPFIGFPAKLGVIQAVLATGYTWLAVLAVLLSVIGAFYYLRIVKLMYVDAPTDAAQIGGTTLMRTVLSVNALIALGLGIMPAALLTLCQQAIQ